MDVSHSGMEWNPEEQYERIGDVNNVVFPTGACVIDDKLHVYYGGADKVCCLAIVELSAD
jgi:beta-1,2-mannobiose phosphorylase / 1,2-beta-oligomannan phosphorylase